MSLKKILFKNTFLNMAGYAYLLITSLISIPIIIQNLGQTQYGIYVLFISLTPLLSTIDLGLSQASIRYLALPNITPEERKKIWSTNVSAFITLAISLSLFCLILLLFQGPRMTAFQSVNQTTFIVLTILSSLIVFLNHLNIGLLSLPQADQRFDIYNTRVLFIGTANTLGSAFASYYFKTPIALLSTQVVGQLFSVISLLSYAFITTKDLKFNFGFDPVYWKKLISFGIKQFISNVANQINFQASKFLIGANLPAQAVTAFSVPQNVVVKAAGGVSQLTLALFPMSASLSTKEKLPKLKRLVFGLQLMVFCLGLIGLYVIYQFGLPILIWWLRNEEFAISAYPVLKVLGWYFFLNILTPIPTSIIESLNYPQISAFFASFTSIINLSLLVYLLPQMGLIGAAYSYLYSSLISVPIFLITFLVILNRYQRRLNS